MSQTSKIGKIFFFWSLLVQEIFHSTSSSRGFEPPQNVWTVHFWKGNAHLWNIGIEKRKKLKISLRKKWEKIEENFFQTYWIFLQDEVFWKNMSKKNEWICSFWESIKCLVRISSVKYQFFRFEKRFKNVVLEIFPIGKDFILLLHKNSINYTILIK